MVIISRLRWMNSTFCALTAGGEAPLAFVVQGARADERELREFARANLAHFKAPHTVTFVKELPKTATGKILKYVLSATACDHSTVSCIGRQMLRRDAEKFRWLTAPWPILSPV